MRLWGGRFTQQSNIEFKIFNKSLVVDYCLVEYDIFASIAWSQALMKANVISEREHKKIKSALSCLLEKVKKKPEQILSSHAEDIHSWIEEQLIISIGPLGKKLHTGRSRNDQVTTDLKLWCKVKIKLLIDIINNFQKMLIIIAEANTKTIMPGYTHLQRAQPITFAFWCIAYIEMMKRDIDRLQDLLKRIDVSPLGSGAISGTSWNIDRTALAISMGFACASKNALDSVSDRDYVVELLSIASISMLHLARFSEDLIFFNSGEVNFIELSDDITSGSSLMPQKKNPDILELIRAKTARVHGSLMSILVLLKGLPLAYNKDMQEDKSVLFSAIEIWKQCLSMSILVLKNITINQENCRISAKQGYSNATELADYLVGQGVPFRESHKIVGKIVLEAMRLHLPLEDMELSKLQSFSSLIKKDVYKYLTLESCIQKRNSQGGVSFNQVCHEINNIKIELGLM